MFGDWRRAQSIIANGQSGDCDKSEKSVIWDVIHVAFRLLMLMAMAISLLAVFTPLTRAMTIPAPRAECCAKMNMGDGHNDCGKQGPKSKQNQQCCAACTVCLNLLSAPVKPSFYPPPTDYRFGSFFVGDHSRSDRPPVPPPRTWTV